MSDDELIEQASDRVNDLARRIAAADAAWMPRAGHAGGDYCQYIARHLDAFNPHVIREGEAIERIKGWLADRFQGDGIYRGRPKVLARHALQLLDEVIAPLIEERAQELAAGLLQHPTPANSQQLQPTPKPGAARVDPLPDPSRGGVCVYACPECDFATGASVIDAIPLGRVHACADGVSVVWR